MTKVYLAVGHGHRDNGTFDPGAVGGGWTEQSAGDIIVGEAARLLRHLDVDIRHEAFQDDPNYPGTTRAANAWDADYVVEVHHDWAGAPSGAFGHWYTAAGQRLADDIQRAVGVAGFPLRAAWHKRRTDLYILKHTKAPCVLYEVGRIGDDVLDEPHELRAMGAAIAAGIASHLNLSTVTPAGDDDMTDQDRALLEDIDRKLDLVLAGKIGGRTNIGGDVRRLRLDNRAIGRALDLTVDNDGEEGVDIIS